ncbi:MAG TPA: universal stress protein [Thermoanaerobaculia bacterium]|nr:universal stress protein [Thermoanaerobaculia bacterium]
MKIVVATDGSRGGAAALKFAARLAARDASTELTIITVESQQTIRPSGGVSIVVKPGPPPTKQETRRKARRVLDEAAQKLRRYPVRARFHLVASNRHPIPETISREADRLKADLVVIGSEGRDTLSEWVVGGTALRLIYVARRPVAVVRPPRRRKTV